MIKYFLMLQNYILFKIFMELCDVEKLY